MTIYECHGCGTLYDDEVGMPGKCCEKTIRHKYLALEGMKRMSLDEFKGKLYALLDEYGQVESFKIKYKDGVEDE